MTDARRHEHEQEQGLLGARIGRYLLVRPLGAGGMGAVYEAHRDDGEKFAMKVIRGDVVDSEGDRAVRRFVREASAAAQIDSPYVARVVEAGADEQRNLPYIVMELLSGRDLAALLREHGALQPAAVVPIFVQACLGLAAAHARGIVHRDVKPANLFLHEEGDLLMVKVCDFGIAKQTLTLDQSMDLTRTGGVVGSPMYMSPEQAQNARNVDFRTDIFSLGVTLFEALTGRCPWTGSTVGELILAICTGSAPDVSRVAPWTPPELAAVVNRMLAQKREDRFASAEEVASALRPLGDAAPSLLALRSLDHDQRQMLTISSGPIGPELAGPRTIAVSEPAASSPFGSSPSTARIERQPGGRRWALWLALASLAAVVGVAAFRELGDHPPPRFWTASRPTIAVIVPSLDSSAPCVSWFPADFAEGLTYQLAAGSKVRALGPRDLAGVSPEATKHGAFFRSALGADALVQAVCARTGADPDAVTIRLRVVSTKEGGPELASLRVTGSARAPAEFIARVGERTRRALGIEPASPEEIERGTHATPASPEAAQAYVDGLERLTKYDAAGARAALERAIAHEPRFALAHSALAEALAYIGAEQDAAKERAVAAQDAMALPNEVRLGIEGDAALASYAWSQAIETYRAILRVFPDRSDIAPRLAQAYISAGRNKDARSVLDDLRANSPADPRLHLSASEAFTAAGDFGGARDEAREARTAAHAVGLRDLEAKAAQHECVATRDSAAALAPDGICAEADRLETEVGDRAGTARVLLAEVYLLTIRGDLDQAEALCARASDLVSFVSSRAMRARVLIAQSSIAANRENLKDSIALGREAIREADAAGNIHIGVSARMELAASLQDSGDGEGGGRMYQEALPLARASGNDAFVAIILQNLAIYWMNKGEVARARDHATESLTIEERIGDEFDRPWSLDELAVDEVESNEPERAKMHAEQAFALREKLSLPTDPSRKILATALLRLKDLDGALREAKTAYDAAAAKGSFLVASDVGLVLAEVYIARGDPKAALAQLDASAAAAEKVEGDMSVFSPARALALLLLGRGAEALRLLEEPTPSVLQRRQQRLVRGEMLVRAGRRKEALGDLQALASEAHAAGDFSVEEGANALIAGKIGLWYL